MKRLQTFKKLFSRAVDSWVEHTSFTAYSEDPRGGECCLEDDGDVELRLYLPAGRFKLPHHWAKSFVDVSFSTVKNADEIGMPTYSSDSIIFDGEGLCNDYYVDGTVSFTLDGGEKIWEYKGKTRRYLEYIPCLDSFDADFQPVEDLRPSHFSEIEELNSEVARLTLLQAAKNS